VAWGIGCDESVGRYDTGGVCEVMAQQENIGIDWTGRGLGT
jgi:hypothetical protein